MKFVLVAAIVLGLIIGRRVYVQYQARLHAPKVVTRRVPPELLDGSARTWIVFTTPLCASCGPVKDQLAAEDPSARIVTVDATREPHLADAFEVRSAPTVVLADARGEVQARLVGAPAVRNYLAARPSTA